MVPNKQLLKSFRKELRDSLTPAEAKLWTYLQNSKLDGRKFRRQHSAVYYDISFIWLIGGLKPDYHTIARFRRRYGEALKNILKQCAEMCIKLDMVVPIFRSWKYEMDMGLETMRAFISSPSG